MNQRSDIRTLYLTLILQFLKLTEEFLLIQFYRFANMNQLIGCIFHSFLIHQKLFIKLLTRPKARELNLNIFTHTETGQFDQVLCQS